MFINRLTFNSDGEIREIRGSRHWKSDFNSGNVIEILDNLVDENISKIINGIITSEKTLMRYEGDNAIQDRQITFEEKENLKQVINVFLKIGGTLP